MLDPKEVCPIPWSFDLYTKTIVDANLWTVCKITASSIEEENTIASFILECVNLSEAI